MLKTRVVYEVCDDSKPGEGPFEPTGFMRESLKDALIELRETRKRYPNCYLAKVVFSRCPELVEDKEAV